MQEVWVEIKDYPNYAVSNYGRVFNIQRETFLTPRPNDEGYLRVTLSVEGQPKDFYVSRLVASAFILGYDSYVQVVNYDGDKENNRLDNLRLRKREPSGNSFRSSRGRSGQKVRIVETGAVYRTARDAADYIGGDYGSIYACLRGERRTHMGYTFEYYDGLAG